ncbi:hypothetical protein TNCV_2959051 [Trichonephila clavipes]|nr:hypothetical protein TNCV_2959051 [Trichonephila clavipes]
MTLATETSGPGVKLKDARGLSGSVSNTDFGQDRLQPSIPSVRRQGFQAFLGTKYWELRIRLATQRNICSCTSTPKGRVY